MELRVGSDFERWPEFRGMAAKFGREVAMHVMWRLWVDLAHLASVTRRVGFLPEGQVDLFREETRTDGGATWFNEMVGSSVDEMRMLRRVEGGYQCDRFEKANGHLSPDFKPMHMRGADASRFSRRQNREEQQLAGQTLLLPEDVFRTPDGGRMDPETVRRVTLLVKSLDNALGRPARAPGEFSAGLVRDAWEVAKVFGDDELGTVCRKVMAARGHPGLPATTEQILPQFEEIARGLNIGR